MESRDVFRCPCLNGKKPETEDGFCYGFIDVMTDKTISCCRKCNEWIYGGKGDSDEVAQGKGN